MPFKCPRCNNKVKIEMSDKSRFMINKLTGEIDDIKNCYLTCTRCTWKIKREQIIIITNQ